MTGSNFFHLRKEIAIWSCGIRRTSTIVEGWRGAASPSGGLVLMHFNSLAVRWHPRSINQATFAASLPLFAAPHCDARPLRSCRLFADRAGQQKAPGSSQQGMKPVERFLECRAMNSSARMGLTRSDRNCDESQQRACDTGTHVKSPRLASRPNPWFDGFISASSRGARKLCLHPNLCATHSGSSKCSRNQIVHTPQWAFAHQVSYRVRRSLMRQLGLVWYCWIGSVSVLLHQAPRAMLHHAWRSCVRGSGASSLGSHLQSTAVRFQGPVSTAQRSRAWLKKLFL